MKEGLRERFSRILPTNELSPKLYDPLKPKRNIPSRLVGVAIALVATVGLVDQLVDRESHRAYDTFKADLKTDRDVKQVIDFLNSVQNFTGGDFKRELARYIEEHHIDPDTIIQILQHPEKYDGRKSPENKTPKKTSEITTPTSTP